MIVQLFLILLIHILFYFSHPYICKLEIFKKKNDIHNFNENKIIPLGGVIIISSLIPNFSSEYFNFLIFLSAILIIGFLSDIQLFESPFKRLLLIILSIAIYCYSIELTLTYKNFPLISDILRIKSLNYLFLFFCVAIVVNGINLVDGTNNNSNIYFLIFNLVLIYFKLRFNLNYELNVFLMFICICFFMLNYQNKFMLGDSGAYMIGAIMAFETVNLVNNIDEISRYFAIVLLIYPCYETLFSFVRKIKVSPFKADIYHFHILLYNYVGKRHFLTSILINTFNFIFIFIGSFFYNNDNVLIFLIMTYIIFYNLIYISIKLKTKLF